MKLTSGDRVINVFQQRLQDISMHSPGRGQSCCQDENADKGLDEEHGHEDASSGWKGCPCIPFEVEALSC
jgi:hypothetical protein